MEVIQVVITAPLSGAKPIARLLFIANPVTDRRVKNFAVLFVELGYEVEIVYAASGEPEVELPIEGVKFKHLRLEYSDGPRMFLQYSKLLGRELRTASPCDILFACELFSLISAADAKANGLAKELLYDARELYTELPTVADNPLKKWYWKRQERIGLKKTDVVIVTAPDDADAIGEVHGFLPPSVVVRNFPRREEYRPNNYLGEYFHIPTDKKIFVYVGGLQIDRGLEKMMALMPQLQREAVFVIIGEGVIETSLRELCRNRNLEGIVFFHPPVQSENVIKILSSADAGVSLIEMHSRSYELALPSKVFEYMVAGLPVLSSPLKQVRDLLEQAEGIVFADPDNRDSLLVSCRKILEYAGDSMLRSRIYQNASNNFTFEADAEVFKTFLKAHSTTETRHFAP